jgi:hypothetical protein
MISTFDSHPESLDSNESDMDSEHSGRRIVWLSQIDLSVSKKGMRITYEAMTPACVRLA